MRSTSETFFLQPTRTLIVAYSAWWLTGSLTVLLCLPALGVFWPLVLLWPLAVIAQWHSLQSILSIRALQFDGRYCLRSQLGKEPELCLLTGRWQLLPWLVALEVMDEKQRRSYVPVLPFMMDANSFRRLRIRVNTGQCKVT